MVIRCGCGQLIGVVAGKRIVVGNKILPLFLKNVKCCKVTFIWILGWGIEIRKLY